MKEPIHLYGIFYAENRAKRRLDQPGADRMGRDLVGLTAEAAEAQASVYRQLYPDAEIFIERIGFICADELRR